MRHPSPIAPIVLLLTTGCLFDPGYCGYEVRGLSFEAELSAPGSTLTGKAWFGLTERSEGGIDRRVNAGAQTIFSSDLAVVLDTAGGTIDTVISLPLNTAQAGRYGERELGRLEPPAFESLEDAGRAGTLVFELLSTPRPGKKLSGPLVLRSESDWDRPSCTT